MIDEKKKSSCTLPSTVIYLVVQEHKAIINTDVPYMLHKSKTINFIGNTWVLFSRYSSHGENLAGRRKPGSLHASM